MKRILFMLFASVYAICTYAQTYDETDLIGKWDVTSMTGQVSNWAISFESLYLGETLVTDRSEGYEDWWLCAGYLSQVTTVDDENEIFDPQATQTRVKQPIFDFFISNNNKLHINGDNFIRLVIKELSDDVMKLESYDGKTKIELKKDRSSVNSVVSETPEKDDVYNVQGHKVSTTEKGDIYIKNNRKFIAR